MGSWRRAVPLGAVVALIVAVSATGLTRVPHAVDAAATPPGAIPLVGNFLQNGIWGGTPQEELFTYVPGPGTDTLTTFSRTGGPGGTITITTRPHPVSGTYRPVVGDYDGDTRDEILWYGPGSVPDSMWDFDPAGRVRSRPLRVSGNYRPFSVDLDDDSIDDVFWYAPGAAQDYLWDFQSNPEAWPTPGAYVSRPQTIGGDYVPVAGDLAADLVMASPIDDIFWYAPGPAQDYLWRLTGDGDYVSVPMALGGDYRPFTLDIRPVNQIDVWWYAPGPVEDDYWYWYYDKYLRGASQATEAGGDYHPDAGLLLDSLGSAVVWMEPNGDYELWDYSGMYAGGRRWDYVVPVGATSATAYPAGMAPGGP